MRRWLAGAIAGACWALACAPALAATAYRFQLEGVPDVALAGLLRAATDLEQLAGRPPASPALLQRRAEDDRETMRRVLRAEGYYAGEVSIELQPPAADDGEWTVLARIEAGAPFRLARFAVAFTDTAAVEGFAPSYADLGLARGERARAAAIVAASDRALAQLGQIGHPDARLADRSVTVDHAEGTVVVDLQIAAGRRLAFGPVEVSGLSTLRPAAVLRHVAWTEGTAYDRRAVQQTRQELMTTGLFSSVSIERQSAGADGRAPVRIQVAEAPHRTIGGGVKYGTDQGIGAKAFWETANLFGGAETLRAEVEAAQRRQAAQLGLRMPGFLGTRFLLGSQVSAALEQFDAYDADRYGGGVTLERTLLPHLTGSLGASVERAFITDPRRSEDYTLLGLPAALAWDSVDDPLEPRRGFRLSLAGTPYFDVTQNDRQFNVLRLGGSWYLRFDSEGRYVLAGRAAVGSVLGLDTADVPADKRFYAGGGDSIRGYGYQLAGPLDENDEPLGGGSLLTAGLELRARITESIGAVLFLDAGNAFEGTLPDGNDDLLYGAGAGLRYYTPIGPLRLDVGVPLKRRSIDDGFQVYISLGQAF